MARIVGVDIPNDKQVAFSLTYIYGIGWPTSRAILEKTGIDPSTRVKDLTEEEAGRLYRYECFSKEAEGLEKELAALRESEMWRTAAVVRQLRPENN